MKKKEKKEIEKPSYSFRINKVINEGGLIYELFHGI